MSWWYKRHSELLRKISSELSSNSNYSEKFQYRDNLFVSCGEIIVRSEITSKYPILIAYPDSTPYILPTVFLLKDLYSEDEVKDISKKSLLEIGNHIKNNTKIYDYRHQNADGRLCLLEADNLHKESPTFYSTHSIINRIRDWFAGLITNSFPPDSPEVELFAHFSKQCLDIEFLFPHTFFSKDIVQGEFYSILIAVPPREHLQEKRIYLGALLDGQNESGIYVNSEFKNTLQLLPKGIATPVDLLTKKDILNKAIEEKRLIKGYWWNIDCEPKPFSNVDKFAGFLNNDDKKKGYERFFNILKDEIKGLPDDIVIALRYPNRRGDLEWQPFIMKKGEVKYVPDPGNYTCDNFKDILKNYEVEAIYSEPMTDEKYHQRNSLRAQREILTDKRINIIGCGALGGEIADCLGKAGFGTINLIDNETLRAHNAVRHVASIERMGYEKVYAVADCISKHNPFVEILNSPINILHFSINHYTLPNSISISSIADDNIEGFLNEQAIINNKTVYYARALRGGKCARIFRVIPDKDACLNCLSCYQQDNDPAFIGIPEDPSLPTITNECNNPIRPASAADLKLIASITSRLVINHLQAEESKDNHWIWTTEKIEGFNYDTAIPFAVHSTYLPPHPKCMYCKKEDPIKIWISSESVAFMKSEIERNPTIETGGVLVGYKKDNGDVVVTSASGPGPNAIREAIRFEKDIEFCQVFIDEHYKKFKGKGIYVGEWHYHPNNCNKPSNTDLLSLNQIATQKGYLTEKPIMIIFSKEGIPSCTVHPANKKYYFSDFQVT